jgi:UDP-N-acetyl-D-mannosaminuronic acid transferase (WecB/TagA/CpsF family)
MSSTQGQDRRNDRMVLGVRFFSGTTEEAVNRMMQGGLLLVPAAPALRTIVKDAEYREALLAADRVIPDSAYMVLIWNTLEHDRMPRISGLAYLRELLKRPEVQEPGSTLWIMAGQKSSEKNRGWLREQGIDVPDSHIYLAPMYGSGAIEDAALLEMVERLRPAHILVTVGGGTQERLGLYLRRSLSYKPGIHCIGAAIAFLSGDQVGIPVWADKFYLGWLFRILDEPRRYGPRYWDAVGLFSLIFRYRSRLPPMDSPVS